MKKSILCAAVTGFVLMIALTSANAHLVIESFKGRAGYNEFLSLMVPTGCGSSATTELRMKVPSSIVLFRPEQKGGWETEVVMRKLDEPVQRGRTMITEVLDEVVWRGNLPANQLGVFRFMARMPKAVGSVVAFKTTQKCGDKEIHWDQVIDEGEPVWKMWVPHEASPFVEVIEPDGPQLGVDMKQLSEARQQAKKASGH
jgi:uncharacterized protein YcnI